MAPNLVIFDAMNVLRRIYAAIEHTHDSIERLQQQSWHKMAQCLDAYQASHAVAVFDGEQPGWRHQLWPAYKAGRKPLPAELAQGLDSIQQYWWQQGVDSVLPSHDEADDVIATLTVKAAEHGVNVIIISTDQGFCQLLGPSIQQYDCFTRQPLTIAHYQQKFSISPQQWPQYKALTGESSSDIPGISGFGPATARAFIEQNYDVSTLPPAKQQSWQQEHELVAIFQQLMTLNTERELGFKLSDLRYPK
ncbi:flap endonuclease Xni [Neiella sp. HB171785]|uniref:Flap endonuclease Xni n=1 Tax=Neiella litorisoli TaxID=2771431 RepID=A0A8J6QK85_9GAMM|nr:5'-3' exonuclease H3TH domain-containing protein [Neiella litorisoli]MBD1389726.1 flap endonuclease Xni [Neiella litorisoli]